jgi:hypothetical protein
MSNCACLLRRGLSAGCLVDEYNQHRIFMCTFENSRMEAISSGSAHTRERDMTRSARSCPRMRTRDPYSIARVERQYGSAIQCHGRMARSLASWLTKVADLVKNGEHILSINTTHEPEETPAYSSCLRTTDGFEEAESERVVVRCISSIPDIVSLFEVGPTSSLSLLSMGFKLLICRQRLI